MPDHVSISQINLFEKCELQYAYRYLDKYAVPSSPDLIRGAVVHRSIGADLQHKVDHDGELMDDDAVADLTRDAVNEEFEAEVVLDKGVTKPKAKGATVDSSIRLSLFHHNGEAHFIAPEPKGVERKFEIEAKDSGLKIVGIMDVVEKEKTIDHKVRSRSPSEPKNGPTDADKSMQLTAYALARQIEKPRDVHYVQLNHLVALKRGPKLARQTSPRSAQDFETFLRRVALFKKRLESGDFYPTAQDSWACSSKYCPFYDDVCPFGRRGRTSA